MGGAFVAVLMLVVTQSPFYLCAYIYLVRTLLRV